MKLFLKKILFFNFPLIIIIIMMDLYLSNMNSLYKEKANGMLEHANEIEILILGNSHALRGVNPKYFTDNTYNTANSGQSIYFDKEITLRSLERLNNLKYVFISLDYHSLYFSIQRGERNVWSYFGNGIKHSSIDYNKADVSPFLFGYSPLVSFSLLKKDILTKWKFRNHAQYLDFDTEEGVSKTDTLVKGFITFSKTRTNDFSSINYINRINVYDELIYTSTEKKLVLNELDKLITTLQKNGVTPIFFSTPTYKKYNTELDSSIINNNRIDAEILCKKYNMEFWDYSVNNDFTIHEFFNPDHLNKKGSARFSKMLDSRLKLYKN